MSFNPIVIIVSLCGLYLLIRLRFFFILHPIRTARQVFRGLKRWDTLRSLFLALSGTLGVGNILGVAVGIIVGGAGSVFWMLLSTVFASVLKYAEVTLSTDGATRDPHGAHGGMHYALVRFFGRVGGILATVYSVSVILLSFSMGAALQSAALVGSVGAIFDTPPIIIGVLLAFVVLFTVVFGTRIIEKITAVVIPLTTIVYIILTISVIVVCRENISGAVVSILSSAFSKSSALGGAFGFLFSRTVSEGFSRGLLSNEAGAGTSSIAHARGSSLHPSMCGIMGIVEVVFDTTILCTLTALAILCAVPDHASFTDGISLVIAMTFPLGISAPAVLCFCISAFAFSTVVCWYFYSTESYYAIFGRRCVILLPLYLSAIIYGSVSSSYSLIIFTDVLLFILTAITSFLLIKKSDRICTLSEGFGLYGRPGRLFKFKKSGFKILKRGIR